MSNDCSRSITNSFQDVRLVSLASWSKASEIDPRDSGGPYVVTQEGYDPGDIGMAGDEFVLGKSGEWLSLALFYRLPVAERRDEFVFGTAAEVMRVLEDLPPKVVVARPGETELVPQAEAGKDDLSAALESGRRSSEEAE